MKSEILFNGIGRVKWVFIFCNWYYQSFAKKNLRLMWYLTKQMPGPPGVITLQTDESIELAVNAIHVMAECICYDVDGNPCPPVNNDGCCYPGTAPGTDNDCEPALTSPCDNDGFCEDGESCTCPDCFPCSTCAWTPWTPQTLCNAPCGGTDATKCQVECEPPNWPTGAGTCGICGSGYAAIGTCGANQCFQGTCGAGQCSQIP